MSKQKKFFSGKGYYIALILGAIAIGVSGYLYYRNESKNNDVDPGQAVLSTDAPSDDVEAVATQPLKSII